MRKKRKRNAGKAKPGRRPARRKKSSGMGLIKKLLLAAVVFAVAAVMAFRGCPRSRGGHERHFFHSSRAEHLFPFFAKKKINKAGKCFNL